MGDVKCYLRKMDFPSVVPEALRHIQKLWLPDCSSQQLGLMKELSEEFVFFEIDKWGNSRTQKLPPIKELQIVERISWYFRTPENDQKMATFQFLFPFGSKILDNRLPVLGKLLSLSVATENGNVLTYIGTWMQLCACTSDYSAFIAKAVITEHIKASQPSDRMKSLPYVSQVFCASLISAVTNMYINTCPPNHIINIILDWINNVPTLCFSPFKLNIPKSFNFPGPQTPIPGLIFWCVISPLYNESANISEDTLVESANTPEETLVESANTPEDTLVESANTPEDILVESANTPEDTLVESANIPEDTIVSSETFSLLHLSLLKCMMKYNPRELPRCEVVSSANIVLIAETLKKITHAPKEHLDKALDRFAMCVEIALSSNCLQAHPKSLGKLFQHCLQLPYNRPLKIILEKWTTVVLHPDS